MSAAPVPGIGTLYIGRMFLERQGLKVPVPLKTSHINGTLLIKHSTGTDLTLNAASTPRLRDHADLHQT